MIIMEELSFKNKDPGAVQYGNFINYYQFHSVEERTKLLPQMTPWNQDTTCYALDLGCNAGDLTISVHQVLKNNLNKNCYTLGVDIDPILIQRAKEKETDDKVQFLCLDFMDTEHRRRISEYLTENSVEKFSAVFCFSITMWIHLNHGDDGLKLFLMEVCKLGKLIVIEPQPWKCYRKALKRLKSAKSVFPLFSKLTIRSNVEEEMERFLVENCDCVKVFETDRTTWGRKITIFKTD